eukprot:TRINITY_DN5196_c0_g2_i5.p1 TRINITY_DN5196_c0_g2~~TRINITY_DN5196_c0_g2_i5.p1  ORF type:complete len:131 (+),score=15.19 TRINITY_DN5196_c0_g2_i5:122-514(+)
MENDYHFAFKVVVVGDPGVGKTSLVIRHTTEQDGGAVPKILPGKQSVGINFRNKTYLYDGKTYRVQFWDAPGAERYMKLTARYCAGTAAAIFVYDGKLSCEIDFPFCMIIFRCLLFQLCRFSKTTLDGNI